MIRPCSWSKPCSDCRLDPERVLDPWCGGLAAAELLKKKEEETEGSEDTESEEGLFGSEGLDSLDEANRDGET